MINHDTKFIPDAAQTDYLTGLANRRGLYDYFSTLSENTIIHAMFIDIDNFKRVNDTYGHSQGDALLIKISELISGYPSCITSRIGGDEYVVIFKGTLKPIELKLTASKMLEAMHTLDFRKDILSLVSLSIGIVFDQPAVQGLDAILNKCDAAMYQAKFSGKNRYAIYQNDDSTPDLERTIELEMEDALKSGEFESYLQPKMNMITFQLVGAEALSRWQHPKDGLRLPELYIPVFEKNGFIRRLDMYMIETVCRIKSGWKGRKYEHLPISFDISRLHLFDEEFTNTLTGIADRYGIPHEELEVEIKEGVFIKDKKEMDRLVNELTSRNFKVSIDNFGSGFSALSLLQDIPVDTIKLDREFISKSCASDRGRRVIKNIIALCKDLKLDVVTEGITTNEQAEFIMSCGCSIAQGFLYSDPLPISSFENYAEEYMTNPTECVSFSLDGTLNSDDESRTAVMNGCGLKYGKGIFNNSRSMIFPGGCVQDNTLVLPNNILVNDSFTVSMWINPRENHVWTAALYLKFETGFAAIVPQCPNSQSTFRIRDYKNVNGWYDLLSLQLQENVWSHYVITYNSRTEKAVAFINGDPTAILDHVPTNHYLRQIVLGGDVYQPSFTGKICEVKFYNEAKDYDFVKQLHLNYLLDPNFCGFKAGSLDELDSNPL